MTFVAFRKPGFPSGKVLLQFQHLPGGGSSATLIRLIKNVSSREGVSTATLLAAILA